MTEISAKVSILDHITSMIEKTDAHAQVYEAYHVNSSGKA